jgi:hypothetical protein
MNSSKDLHMHSHAIDFFQAWYNFVKPDHSLRLGKFRQKKMDAANSCDGGMSY